jgi:uncharacterized protein (DUF433 family)
MEPTTIRGNTETSEAASRPALDRVRIVSTPGTCGGKPRIDGHRITVKHIILDHQREGKSPDEIASAYPSLTLSDIYAALAYYHDHRDDIDADIKADDDHWAEIQQQDSGRLIDRLRQRKADAADTTLPPR